MKKGSLVSLIALSALIVFFSAHVTGQWAGVPWPPGKRESLTGSYGEVRIRITNALE